MTADPRVQKKLPEEAALAAGVPAAVCEKDGSRASLTRKMRFCPDVGISGIVSQEGSHPLLLRKWHCHPIGVCPRLLSVSVR